MRKALIFLMTGAILLSPVLALGQDPIPPSPITTLEQIFNLLNQGLVWFYAFMLIVIVAMILFAGFQFLTAGGDSEKFGAAKTSLLYALVGIAVVILASGAMSIVESILESGS